MEQGLVYPSDPEWTEEVDISEPPRSRIRLNFAQHTESRASQYAILSPPLTLFQFPSLLEQSDQEPNQIHSTEESDVEDADVSHIRLNFAYDDETRSIQYPPQPSPSSPSAIAPQQSEREQPPVSGSAEPSSGDSLTPRYEYFAVQTAFLLSVARIAVDTFTYHAELNSAEHASTYEEVLKKSLIEWYTVGAFVSPIGHV